MTTATVERKGGFFGEPPALGFLAFTEAWERFSYYGMTAILVLYMSQALFLPGHVEHIVGFAQLRGGLERVFGPMTTVALASQVYGLYTAFVYFTPVLGGWIADRFTGRRTAVVVGALMMSGGHLAMAFDQSFLFALLLLIVGCGLLKGNISTQVGELYAESDGEGRTRAFAIFSVGINVGAVVGPLVCGYLGETIGWHWGFGCATVLMLIGLVTYLVGLRHLPDDRPRKVEAEKVALSAHDWRVVLAIAIVAALTIFQTVSYYQNGNINLVWIDQHVDLDLLGFKVPTAWFNSIDPLASIVFVPPLIALWRWQDRNGGEPSDLAKIATGAAIAATANGLLVIGCLLSPRVSAIYPIVYDILLGIAFLYYWPTLLALVSRTAPPSVKGTLMGAVFLSLFVGNFLIGWIGQSYERMTPADFWGIHAAIAAAGAIFAVLVKAPLMRVLEEHKTA